MKHIKLFEQFVNESLDYTAADAADAAGVSSADMKKEEKVLATALKYLGAKSLSDLYYAGDDDADDVSSDFSLDKVTKMITVKGSYLYGDGSGKTTIGLGKMKGELCVSISDGSTTFYMVGPKSVNAFG